MFSLPILRRLPYLLFLLFITLAGCSPGPRLIASSLSTPIAVYPNLPDGNSYTTSEYFIALEVSNIDTVVQRATDLACYYGGSV